MRALAPPVVAKDGVHILSATWFHESAGGSHGRDSGARSRYPSTRSTDRTEQGIAGAGLPAMRGTSPTKDFAIG
jgi:hypothetical protein